MILWFICIMDAGRGFPDYGQDCMVWTEDSPEIRMKQGKDKHFPRILCRRNIQLTETEIIVSMDLEVEQADGSDTANLKFESYEITKGKYSLKGLPAMFAKEDEAETLEIVLADRVSGLKAHLLYSVFPHLM